MKKNHENPRLVSALAGDYLPYIKLRIQTFSMCKQYKRGATGFKKNVQGIRIVVVFRLSCTMLLSYYFIVHHIHILYEL